jgi:Rho-binding antiterminator
MSDYQPIACHVHDYIEIACLYNMAVELLLRDGEKLSGKARTTRTSADHREYLIVDLNGDEQEIDLIEIARMRALQANPHFDQIDFK